MEFVAPLEREGCVGVVVDGQSDWTTDNKPCLPSIGAQVRLKASDLGLPAQAAERQHGHGMGFNLEQVDAGIPGRREVR